MRARPVAGEAKGPEAVASGGGAPRPAGAEPGAAEQGAAKPGEAAPGMATHAAPVSEGVGAVPRDRLWPVLITVGLLLVVLVNVLFIYIAVKGADGVDPSYFSEER
jgi:hypothetical protein